MGTPLSQSSPVKPRKNSSISRKQLSCDTEEGGILEPSAAFLKQHLKVPADWERFKEGTDAQIELVSTIYLPEQQCYDALCELLNTISSLVHDSLSIPDDDELVFLDHHASPLTHHPFDKDLGHKPDILTVRLGLMEASDYEHTPAGNLHLVPWHHADSVLEWISQNDLGGTSQCAVYAGDLNQARPDKPGSYTLSASPQWYMIMWSDPSGCIYSYSNPWGDLEALVGYVHSLYTPPDGHITFDPTIKRSSLNADEDPLGPPLWDVTFNKKTYQRCETIFVGAYWSRMTWVARSLKTGITIKDSYRSDTRRWDEGKLFQDVHKDGFVGGWVQVSASGDVMTNGKAIKTGIRGQGRTKKRIVMTNTGDNIYSCSSVVHFLKVMYDVLEAHRWVAANRRVLHRDISINNLLVNPTGGVPCSETDGKRPKFIDEVLDPSLQHAPAYALICDLDNGRHRDREPDPMPDHDGVVKERSGTPVYISRSVSIGRVLTSFSDYVAIPELLAESVISYIAAHPDDVLRAYVDLPGQYHGGTHDPRILLNAKKSRAALTGLYDHYPRHDAESAYWVMVAFFLRDLPDGDAGDSDNNEKNLINEWGTLNNHVIGASDTRVAFFSLPLEDWEDRLHPKLKCVAPLLQELSEQVSPEYAFLRPPPHEMHLHEAMQRLILIYIVSLSASDVPLNMKKLRTVKAVHELKEIEIKSPSIGS